MKHPSQSCHELLSLFSYIGHITNFSLFSCFRAGLFVNAVSIARQTGFGFYQKAAPPPRRRDGKREPLFFPFGHFRMNSMPSVPWPQWLVMEQPARTSITSAKGTRESTSALRAASYFFAASVNCFLPSRAWAS